MFNFSQEFDNETEFENCVHLRDFAAELGVNTDCAFGLSEDMETEQLAGIEAALKQAVAEELERLEKLEQAKLPACGIGPYANGICTICGGRQPGA